MLDPGTIKVDPLTYYADAPGKVGELCTFDHPTYGRQLLRLVKASADCTAYAPLAFDSGSSLTVQNAGAAAVKSKVAGFCQCAIPNTKYGYVVVDGDCLAVADAAIAADAQLSCRAASAAGRVDDAAIAAVADLNAVIAHSVGSAAAPADTLRIRVKCL